MANENVTPTTALIGLSGQLDTVRTEIAATNIGLQNVASLIQTDSLLDQQRLLQERERERRLLESQVRVGTQLELQKKVTAAVAGPVKTLETKLTNTFSNVTRSLQFLFTGVIGPALVVGFKRSSKLGLKALTGIKDLIKNSFSAIGSGLSFLRGGFGSVIRSIIGVTSRISKAILSLAASPVKAIADVFKKFVPGAKPTGTGAGAGAGVNLFGLIGRSLSGVGAVQNAMEGNPVGAAAYGAAALFPNPITTTAALVYTGANLLGYKPENILKNSFTLPKIDFGSMSQSMSEMGSNISNFLDIDLKAPTQKVQGNVEGGNTADSQKPASPPGTINLDTVPFTSPAKPSTPVSQLPEAKPDIIYTSTGQQSQSSVVSGETQTLTDVPLISSSNPDNFYTLYAQVSYNVVI